MKRIKFLLATILTVAIGIFCLGACSTETGMAGTYYFASVQAEVGGEMKVYGIGDTFPSGVVAKKNVCAFHLKSDGSIELTAKVEGNTQKMTGTWEVIEGETNKIIITIDDDPVTCDCDGSTLVMTPPDNLYTVTLKK